MKLFNFVAPTLVAVCLVVVPLAWSQGGNAEKQIAALSDQFVQAMAKADTNFMEKHLADEFTAIHSDGKLTTKAQEIDNLKTSTLKWDSVEVHDRKIRDYGDAATVIMLATSKGTISGKPYSGDFRTTQVWVKNQGDWKMVAFQSTRVASASQ
jgi:hypothetical protein